MVVSPVEWVQGKCTSTSGSGIMLGFQYKDPNSVTNTLLVCFVLGLIFEVFSIFSGFLQYSSLVSYRDGGDITGEVAEANAQRQFEILMVKLGVFLVTAVVFCFWTHRIVTNAHAITTRMFVTPGWAVGFYFIPILLLWKPYQALREAYEAFQPRDGTVLFPLWWFAWISSGVLDRIVSRVVDSSESVDECINASALLIVMGVWGVFLHVIVILLVLKVTKECQDLKKEIDDDRSLADAWGRLPTN